MTIRIVAISDTHNYHKSIKNLPTGDILIHAGDATSKGYLHEIEAVGNWLRKQPHMYKIIISGNHDFGYQDDNVNAKKALYGTDDPSLIHKDGIYYLQDELLGLEIDGQKVRIYGSPWQPWFHSWAFNAYSPELKEKWDRIPKDLDILVTHGPPYRLLDMTLRGEHVGCRELRTAIQRTKPKLHVCGHIHEDHGVARFSTTWIANAAVCDRSYNPIQQALVFELHEDGTMQKAPEIQGIQETKDAMSGLLEALSESTDPASETSETTTSDEGQD